MNLAVFELIPCLSRAKQHKIKGLTETRRQATNTGRQTELQVYEQWIFEGVKCSNAMGWVEERKAYSQKKVFGQTK